MTTLSFNQVRSFNNIRPLNNSFAAHLAKLQARHEQATGKIDVVGVIARGVLALVPSFALAWMFVSL